MPEQLGHSVRSQPGKSPAVSKPLPAVILAACSWTAVLLVINDGLFRFKLIETGDQATILFQVRDAEHFRELLGNYSRWFFHHPGPGFLYILALGDAVFRRLLHLTPEPMNSAYLTLLLLNVAFLFVSIRVFARHCRSALFLPIAVVLSLWVIYVINSTYGPVATTNVWMPHIILFVFLLFAVVCASVATGTVTDLPILVGCGGLLVHGHVAQALFVTVLSGCALLTLYLTSIRQSSLAVFLRANRRTMVVSAILLAVFLMPLLLDLGLDHPNNVQKIRAYLSEHRGERNRFRSAVKYEGSFFTFTPNPEASVTSPGGSHLISTAVAKLYIRHYWMMAIFLAAIALAARRKAKAAIPPFLIYIAFEVLLISALFVYWAKRITGPLYDFNGFFYYAIQFLILFTLAAIALDGLQITVNYRWSLGLACAVPLLMFSSPASFNRVGTNAAAASDPWFEHAAEDSQRIAAGLPRQQARIRVRAPDGIDGLLRRTGVASRLHWTGQPVCFDERWVFLLEDRDRCEHVEGLLDLDLNPAQLPDQPWSAELKPFPAETLPFTLNPGGQNSLSVNFYGPDDPPDGPIWSKKRSLMRFLLTPDWKSTPQVRIEIDGTAVKGRPVRVLLNGENVGTILGDGAVTSDFQVSRDQFRAGRENELAFEADGAGPVGHDFRTLGFKFASVKFEPVEAARTTR